MRTRQTQQKEVIALVLAKAERPLTTHELLKLAQKHIPTLGIATVYREINRLCEEKALRTVTIPGDAPRYEKAAHHHHHFKCNGCDKVYELEGCLKNISRLLPKGFKHINHDLTFYGMCRQCA